MKKTKLEETFNLPPINFDGEETETVSDDEVNAYTTDEMHEIMERADKIDAALPQVANLDAMDADYDGYADKAMSSFQDLVDLGMNVEDRLAADIFNAASGMMTNALNAKTNKAQKKLEMVKLQIQKAKLEHEKEKLDYLKRRHLKSNEDDDFIQETEGKVVTSRNDLMKDILAGLSEDKPNEE